MKSVNAVAIELLLLKFSNSREIPSCFNILSQYIAIDFYNLFLFPFFKRSPEFYLSGKMKFLALFVFIGQLVLFHHGQASFVGWILGRDSSPFSLSSSETKFDHLMSDKEEIREEPQKEIPDSISVETLKIPFELSVADEKFITDAQKYTDLKLSELDVCQHKVSYNFF